MTSDSEEWGKKFIDALEVELDGQELMFDEHEWMTLIKCLREALKVVEEGSSTDGSANTTAHSKLAQEAQSEAPSVDEILDSLNNELVINKNDGFISVDALEQAKAKINRLIVGARLDEHKFWDGFFENEEVDKEELIFHRNIRKEQLSNNLSKGDV